MGNIVGALGDRRLDHAGASALAALSGLSRPIKTLIQIGYDFGTCFGVGLLISQFFQPSTVQPLSAVLAAALGGTVSVSCVAVQGGYSTVVRYMPARSAVAFGLAAIASAVAWLLAADRLAPIVTPGASLYTGMTFALLFGARWALRRAHWYFARRLRPITPVAIYGAGTTGRQLASTLRLDPRYRLVGFFDDDLSLRGLAINGFPTHSFDDAPRIIARHAIEEVVLAMPNASRERRRAILEMLVEHHVRVRTIPGLTELLAGSAAIHQLRAVSPEDVLGRAPVAPNLTFLRGTVEGKVVLVTGAGGSIGSELCRQIVAQSPKALVMLDVSEHALFQIDYELRNANERTILHAELGSACNFKLVRNIIRDHKIDTVIHAAAYKHVPLVEMNLVEGVANNVISTKMLLDAIAMSRVSSFVLVSTDKAVRPTNVMGASKRVAELLVQAAAAENGSCRMSIVRFGNVLGSSGSVLPVFQAQIQAGGPVTLTHPDVTRYFMTIPEAAQLILQASALGESGDIFHLDMGEPVLILDLARRLIRLNGLRERFAGSPGDIEIKIVGLRVGEKLKEELLICDDVKPTPHPRIFRAREQFLTAEELDPALAMLIEALESRDPKTIKVLLGRLVEGFAALKPPQGREQIAPPLPAKAQSSARGHLSLPD